jgi:hypothetical protein
MEVSRSVTSFNESRKPKSNGSERIRNTELVCFSLFLKEDGSGSDKGKIKCGSMLRTQMIRHMTLSNIFKSRKQKHHELFHLFVCILQEKINGS